MQQQCGKLDWLQKTKYLYSKILSQVLTKAAWLAVQ